MCVVWTCDWCVLCGPVVALYAHHTKLRPAWRELLLGERKDW